MQSVQDKMLAVEKELAAEQLKVDQLREISEHAYMSLDEREKAAAELTIATMEVDRLQSAHEAAQTAFQKAKAE